MSLFLLIHGFGLDDILYALLELIVLVGGIVLFFGLIWMAFRSLPKRTSPDNATPTNESVVISDAPKND